MKVNFLSYSKEIYSRAYSILDERRNNAQSVARQNTDTVYAKIPEIEQISRKITECSIAAARAVFAGGDTKSELTKLSLVSTELQTRQADLLRSAGYPADFMEPKYFCPQCHDTGSVERDGKTIHCECFMNLLKECACDEINRLSPLKLSTFDTFRLDYYPVEVTPEGVSPRGRMSRLFDFCKAYADNFNGRGRSLLMRGATGLGKTHLSLAIANELLIKGFYVIYVSAPSLLSKLENSHFDYNSTEEEHLMETLSNCDLLIIDDLGTEFVTQYTKTAVYNIFNNRLLRDKPVIINTNMSIRELESTYSQRFVSRIMGSCDKLDFYGNDIRKIRNINN